jgi:circadian clock protein KaiC
MSKFLDLPPLSKIPTGVSGLDHLTNGGLVEGRATLIVGTSGSGKTLLSTQIAHHGAMQFDRPAVFVTFEEKPIDLVRNVGNQGWDLGELVDADKLSFIDASLDRDIVGETGPFDLSGLLAQIENEVKRTGARIVVLDSLGALFHHYQDKGMIRREIVRLRDTMSELGATSVMTAERLEEYGSISRHGVEEFLSDCVIVLRHVLEQEKTRRTLQVYKLRGSEHRAGEFPFVISDHGIEVLPLTGIELQQESRNERINFGNDTFDEMAGGGLYQDSVVLVSGPTGSGKTLMCTTFAAASCRNDKRTLYLGFEESRAQLVRNAHSWGMDFERWEESKLLRISCCFPESQSLAEHLLEIRRQIDEFEPTRLVIDSVSAMERVSGLRTFREFVLGLTSFLKERGICALLTSTTPELSGGDSVTDAHISTITDAIILLRYIQVEGAVKRGIIIVKMRGSQHQKDFREFKIDHDGLHIGEMIWGDTSTLFGSSVGRSRLGKR